MTTTPAANQPVFNERGLMDALIPPKPQNPKTPKPQSE